VCVSKKFLYYAFVLSSLKPSLHCESEKLDLFYFSITLANSV